MTKARYCWRCGTVVPEAECSGSFHIPCLTKLKFDPALADSPTVANAPADWFGLFT